MEKTWLDTNITALSAINVGVTQTAQANLDTSTSKEIKDDTVMLLLVGLGSRLEVYLPNSKEEFNQPLLATQIFESSASIHGFVTPNFKDHSCSNCNNISKHCNPLINSCSLTLTAFGGKEICLFNIKAMASKVEGQNLNVQISPIMSSHTCKDWILDVRMFHRYDNDMGDDALRSTKLLSCVDHPIDFDLLVLSAHNRVVQYRVSDGNGEDYAKSLDIIWKLTGEILCEEKCILYSGVLVPGKSGTTVLAGTVFQELVIWSVNEDLYLEKSSQDNLVERPVLHRLRGHEGVLFSIAFDRYLNLICTTSDDRTARLWKVKETIDEKLFENTHDAMSSLRQEKCTAPPIEWSRANINLHNVLSSGHDSRIFRCAFLSLKNGNNQVESNNVVATAGEDSKICLWNVDTGHTLKSLIHDTDGRSPIWSLAVAPNSSLTAALFTGGADAAVKMFNLTTVSGNIASSVAGSNDGETSAEFALPNDLTELAVLSTNKGACDYPRIVSHLYNGTDIICLTNMGRVWVISHKDDINDKCTLVLHDEELFNYALMEYQFMDQSKPSPGVDVKCQEFIIFATLNGAVKIYQLSRHSSTEASNSSHAVFSCSILAKANNVHSGKIFAMKVLNVINHTKSSLMDKHLAESDREVNNTFKMLTCGDNGIMKLLDLSVMGKNSQIVDSQNLSLPSIRKSGSKFEQLWFSCCLLLEEDSVLIVGDRMGNIHLFNLKWNWKYDQIILPSQTFWKVHGKLGVGDLKLYTDGKRDRLVWSTGRDGTLRSFTLKEVNKNVKIHNEGSAGDPSKTNFIHMEEKSCNKLKLTWPDKIIVGKGGQIIVLGFHSTNFVAYSLQENAMFCQIFCGGSHRSWAYGFSGVTRNDFMLTFIKDKRIVQRSTLGIGEKLLGLSPSATPPLTIIRRSLHSRELCCVHHFQLQCRKGDNASFGDYVSDDNFVVTSGEDTTIKIHKFIQNKGKLQRLTVATLSGHISNIKCMTSVVMKNMNGENDGNNSVLLVTAGGRAQLKVWLITRNMSTTNDLRTYYSPISCREITSHMLKGNEKKRKHKTWRQTDMLIEDTETRYMDLDIISKNDIKYNSAECNGSICEGSFDSNLGKFANNDSQILIAAACSDGIIRILSLNIPMYKETNDDGSDNHEDSQDKSRERIPNIQVEAESMVHSHTFLRVKFIDGNESKTTNDKEDKPSNFVSNCGPVIILATSTDGKLYRISFNDTCQFHKKRNEKPGRLEMKEVARVHQSGINGLWIHQLNEKSDGASGGILVISGGDDGSIGIAKLDYQANLQGSTVISTALNSVLPIHAAAITDVCSILSKNMDSPRSLNKQRACELSCNGRCNYCQSNSIAYVVTCSIDQRVCLWHLKESIEPLTPSRYCSNSTMENSPKRVYKFELTGLTKRFCNVPDIQSMAMWQQFNERLSKGMRSDDSSTLTAHIGNKDIIEQEVAGYSLAVVGVGMEVFHISEYKEAENPVVVREFEFSI